MSVTTSLTVTGMHCNACVGRVERALGKLEGVSAVRVTLDDGAVAVDHAETVTRAQLEAAIVKVGYAVAA